MNDRVLSTEELAAMGDAIAETAAMIDAATHQLLCQLRAFDQAGGWHRAGALSCAHWLSWRVGMDLGAAREKVRVAKRLAEMPLIDEALRKGEISYSKVRAMTRVATKENEADLLNMARSATGAQMEKICRYTRQVQSRNEKDPRPLEDERRWVMSRGTEDGMVSIQVRLLPEEAARVMKAFEISSTSGSLADGAVALAELALAGVAGDRFGPDGSEVTDRSRAASVRPPVEVVVHVSAETLEGATELGDGIPSEVSRRLLCDAGVVPLLEAKGKTIDVGRKTRTIPSALRRALDARDGGCRFPGCTNRRFVDAHHIHHWIDGGETSLDNTALFCRRHHRYLHEYGYRVERAGDGLIFRDPDGALIPPQGERPWLDDGVTRLREALAGAGLLITTETNAPGWDGRHADYGLCVSALT
jgi:hypothetical protein